MIYLDTSALVKLVVLEPDTEWARSLVSADGAAVSSRITWAEAHAAFARRERELPSGGRAWEELRRQVRDVWSRMRVVDVTQPLVELAGEYALTFYLRGYDAVQLASARTAQLAAPGSWTFLSFDRRLNVAAKLLGLGVPDRVPS